MSIEKERMSQKIFMPKWVRHEHMARFEFVCGLVKDKAVIDCACGTGVGSKMFADAGAKQVLAYDLSADDVLTAQKKNRLSNLVYVMADATDLPCAAQSAEVYVSLETIEHLADDAKFLSEVKRVLKSGGTFICSTPNRTVTNPGAGLSDKPFNKFHTREYSAGEFENLLKKYFSTVEMYGQNSRRRWRVGLSNLVAKIFGRRAAVLFNQILKLPRLVFDIVGGHRVRPAQANREYEYLTAVCK